ncbi:SCO6880 family protein [Streptomyces sp. NPDC059708]|uniref:SCO6880 family protein n=1 Tax=Streptomyces sp. NPDC059708 TaxID=3346916 RepID=UPI00368F3C66
MRTYVLGGETRRRALFNGVSRGQVVSIIMGVLAWLVVMMITRSVWALLGGVVLALVATGAGRRRTALGESWAGSVYDRLAFRFSGKGAPDFVPGQTLPREVGDIRVLAYAPPVARKSPMAIVHHKDNRRASWNTGHLTATFEIQGSGDGLLPASQVDTAGLRFERLLGGLASAEIPVDQLDICTRVLPVHPDAYRDHMAGLVVPTAPERLKASMAELAGFAAGNAEEYRSFATIRVPLAHLQASVGTQMDLDDLCAHTFDLVGDVVRRVDSAGYRLRAVLGPRRLGALIRHLHDPDHDMDNLDGIGSVADGWGQVRHKAKDWTRVEGTGRDWYHAVAHVPRDGWPSQAVTARFMETLVTQVSPATIRTVVSQFRLVPKVQARQMARMGLTYDVATKRGAEKKQQISTGETEASMSAARRTLQDLMQPVTGGVYPAIRVMVSAPDPALLAAARKRVVGAAENGGVTRLDWETYQHHKALVTALPMARGVRA